ncbi:hypothetical protein M758_7G043100 [Ceratodon purpureus]|nr:hypothetical protein M758_7G043100 [Ceratodon purpureus]
MAHGMCRVVVVWATIVIALAAGLVGAQVINCGQSTVVKDQMIAGCTTYLTTDSLLTPDVYCCYELRSVQIENGSPCYCQLYAVTDFATLNVNPTKAFRLPTDCNVAADMRNCTDPSTIPPPAPTFGAPLTPASGSSGISKSLALPIGAAVGGLMAGVLIIGIIWFVVSRCRTSPKPHLEQPVHYVGNPVKPDNYGDKVPADMNGYGA